MERALKPVYGDLEKNKLLTLKPSLAPVEELEPHVPHGSARESTRIRNVRGHLQAEEGHRNAMWGQILIVSASLSRGEGGRETEIGTSGKNQRGQTPSSGGRKWGQTCGQFWITRVIAFQIGCECFQPSSGRTSFACPLTSQSSGQRSCRPQTGPLFGGGWRARCGQYQLKRVGQGTTTIWAY